MNKIYCLTCNGHPVIASNDVKRLEEKMNFLMDTIAEEDTITVINRGEKQITYHTGISYVTEEFEIEELDII